jgi:ADP-ribosylglycohydrolase
MGAGQITDDSEMAMCIMHGLTDPECAVQKDGVPQYLNLDGITYYYGRWSKKAFDIGMATRAALGVIKDVEYKQHKNTIAVYKRVANTNYDS